MFIFVLSNSATLKVSSFLFADCCLFVSSLLVIVLYRYAMNTKQTVVAGVPAWAVGPV